VRVRVSVRVRVKVSVRVRFRVRIRATQMICMCDGMHFTVCGKMESEGAREPVGKAGNYKYQKEIGRDRQIEQDRERFKEEGREKGIDIR
jgi:hypothetical protein